MSDPMTRAERTELAALARKRGRLAKAEVDERARTMYAEAEARLTHGEAMDDAAWQELMDAARTAVDELNERVHAVAAARGIPRELWPSAGFGWSSRGSAESPRRRAELRANVKARLDAEAARAKRIIDADVLRVETELVAAGLTSEAAAGFLAAMPSPAELMASVVLELPDVPQWTPDPEAVAALLSPSTRRGNEAKRAAVLAALAANPAASDREVGRLAAVDHKTVARLRGEIPTAGGESPRQEGAVDG